MEYKNVAEAYQSLLKKCFETPDFQTSPRGLKINELFNFNYSISDITNNIYDNEIRKYPLNYLKGELLWYFMGDNNITFIEKYSKFWRGLVNPDGKTVNSNYGSLLFNKNDSFSEWEWCFKSLQQDSDTRQAVLHFNKPSHSWFGNRDFPCTLTGVFTIRNSELHLTINQRSCDLIKGWTFDIPFFTVLIQQMRLHLLETYPNLKLGKLYHNVNSLHIYENNFEMVEKALKTSFIPARIPELDLDLIEPSGEPTYELKEAYSYMKSLNVEKTISNSKLIQFLIS